MFPNGDIVHEIRQLHNINATIETKEDMPVSSINTSPRPACPDVNERIGLVMRYRKGREMWETSTTHIFFLARNSVRLHLRLTSVRRLRFMLTSCQHRCPRMLSCNAMVNWTCHHIQLLQSVGQLLAVKIRARWNQRTALPVSSAKTNAARHCCLNLHDYGSCAKDLSLHKKAPEGRLHACTNIRRILVWSNVGCRCIRLVAWLQWPQSTDHVCQPSCHAGAPRMAIRRARWRLVAVLHEGGPLGRIELPKAASGELEHGTPTKAQGRDCIVHHARVAVSLQDPVLVERRP
mmetsp:Transcript_41587/g.114603  ORF Transcript_41587/g.114603 Transcript_41587/m.114603 type:complete len:291 (+) Transcript_41587:368-1240(+)